MNLSVFLSVAAAFLAVGATERGDEPLVWAVKLLDADIERLPTHPDCVTDEEDRLMRRIAREVSL